MPITGGYLARRLSELADQFDYAGKLCLFTDVSNLSPILRSGYLFSRSRVIKDGLLRKDCASEEILSETQDWVHDYVRLYHAPLTPMLYQVEGIKRVRDKWPECPQPVYLMFDPVVMTLPNVRLSDGNMRSVMTRWHEASKAAFDRLPFEDIYHRGPIPDDDSGLRIKRRRHAEVLIPDRLSLEFLQALVFRSEAEKRLALYDAAEYFPDVEVIVDPTYFYARQRGRLYVESINIHSATRKLIVEAQNLEPGDVWLAVNVRADGSASAIRQTYSEEKRWGNSVPITPPDVTPYFSGTSCLICYLNGHRVAQRDI